MAIAPITGMLRKRFWVDMSCALGLGTAIGYYYWYVYYCSSPVFFHSFIPKVRRPSQGL